MNEKLVNLYKVEGFIESARSIIQREGLLGGARSNVDEYLKDVENMIYEAIQEEVAFHDVKITTDSLEECQHKKVYDNELLMSHPPQQRWICGTCGEKGIDVIASYQSIGDYSLTDKKFKTLSDKINTYESEIKIQPDRIPDGGDGTEY